MSTIGTSDYQPEPCHFCGGPVVAPRKKGLVKKFCRDKCRAAFRDRAIVQAVEAARAAITDCQDCLGEVAGEVERQQARLKGAWQLLDQAIPKRLHSPAKNPSDTKNTA